MKIVFLVADSRLVSVRFRVLQYVPRLRQRGHAVEVHDLHGSVARRWSALAAARDADVVVVHRAFLSPIELALLRRYARRWVFDFDDAIMFRDSAAAEQQSWQRRARFTRMVRAADGVLAGNEYLADQARDRGGRVTVIPTVVDLVDSPHAADFSGDPVVGWIGTKVNLMYLRAIEPALRRVTERCPRLRVKIVSDGSIEMPGVAIESRSWSAASEAADLATFHVGIMPLADDPWTRGKCGVKLLQYMAAGVPVVCTPVGANAEIVSDGVNGYHARAEDEWLDRVVTLLNDHQLSSTFARAGRETVAQRYSVDAQLDRFMVALSP